MSEERPKYAPGSIVRDGLILKAAEGKIDLTLLDPELEEAICGPYTYGLTKYSRDSWKKFTLEEARKLIASEKRHVNQYRKGEFYDKESNQPHLMMAVFNLLTIYWHEMKHKET